MTQVAIFTV